MTQIKTQLLLAFIMTHIISLAQITCYPKPGDRFEPIKAGVNFRSAPDLNSIIVMKSLDPDDFYTHPLYLICTKEGFENNFVVAKIHFMYFMFEEYGINSNVYFLHKKIGENFTDFDLSLREFYYQSRDSIKMKKLYGLLLGQDWFDNWTSRDQYDMSSYHNFFDYWLADVNDSLELKEFILDHHDSVIYAHKSLLETNNFVFTPYGGDITVEDYQRMISNFLELRKENSCNYSSYAVLSHLERMVDLLIGEENCFEAIKQINAYEGYLTDQSQKHQILFLKLKASYFDNSYSISYDLAKELIEAFEDGNFSNSKESFDGIIDMSFVYGMGIHSAIKQENYQIGLTWSNSCLKDPNLDYPNLSPAHAVLLDRMGRSNEACDFLKSRYLSGDEMAREMFLENCN